MTNIYNASWLKKIKLYNFLNPVKRLCLHGVNIAIVLSIVFFIFLSPVSASKSAVDGLNNAANQGYLGNPGTEDVKADSVITDIPLAIGKIIGLALSFVGLAFFILMIYGGFIWMFARGNDQDVQKAKDLIQAAIIGLIIVLMAYAITMFIGNALTTGGDTGSGSEQLPRI